MALKDLSGKTVYDLDQEDFEKLFCCQCRDYQKCPKGPNTIHACKALVDSGVWDRAYRKN